MVHTRLIPFLTTEMQPSSFSPAPALRLKLTLLLVGALEFYFQRNWVPLGRKDTGHSETPGLWLHLRTQIKIHLQTTTFKSLFLHLFGCMQKFRRNYNARYYS